MDDVFIPKLGAILEGPGMGMIMEAIHKRRENFPDEDLDITIPLILMNIGSRFIPLRCTGREWRGYKHNLVDTGGDPTCPNGHDLIKERGLVLGWVMDDR